MYQMNIVPTLTFIVSNAGNRRVINVYNPEARAIIREAQSIGGMYCKGLPQA